MNWYIMRHDDGEIDGLLRWPQFEGQERLPETHREVAAFLDKPEPEPEPEPEPAPYVLELNLASIGSSERIQQLKELRIEVQRMVEDASAARRGVR